MPELLLDSDIIIELLRENRSIASELERLRSSGWTIAYTPVAKAEIYHGIRSGEERAVERLFTACRSLPIDDAIGEQAGRYLAAYHKSHGVQIADALVAASARIHKAILFTLNRKHYPMKDVKFHFLAA